MIKKFKVRGITVTLNTDTRVWGLPGYEGKKRKLFPEKQAKKINAYLVKEGFMKNGDKFRLVKTGL